MVFKRWRLSPLATIAALLLCGSAVMAVQSVAPPAASADWTYGAGATYGGPGPYPAVATAKTVYDPPSATFLHEGNAAAWLAFDYSYGCGSCNAFGWANYQINRDYAHTVWSVPTTYDVRWTNTSIETLIEIYRPDNRTYCWEKIRVTGTDTSMSWGIDNLSAACGPY